MIESIGYTNDGFIWMRILFDVNGEQSQMVLTMNQSKATEISNMIALAVKEAEHVRNSADYH